MKIYLPNISEQAIGGGWTFLRNLAEGLSSSVEFVTDWKECDIYFICSVTLADRNEVEEVAESGKVIIFRVDNIPKKSRNKRSRVYDNMKRYAELSDMIVFQSEWARNYAGWLCWPNEKTEWSNIIIYNGVNDSVFNPMPIPEDYEEGRPLKYLYVQYNRDENKRFPEAAYYFHMRYRQDPNISLTLVGKFSPENFNEDGTPHFDFFGKENIEYIPPVNNPEEMASIYRDHDILLFPAFADAAPNTVLEARACGLRVECVNPIGGTKEMLDPELDISSTRMCTEYYELFKILLKQKERETDVII